MSRINIDIKAWKMEKLLTINEVAEILGISKYTAKTWASRRVIPVKKIGRLIRISPQELKEWIQRNTEYDRKEALNFRRYKAPEARFSRNHEELIRDIEE